jgi:glycine cleavage system aminomethyltransferase T
LSPIIEANMLVVRDLAKCEVGQCKYVFVTAPDRGIINDPVLLRLGEDHFWLSLADSDVLLWALGVAHGSGLDVRVREADVGPVQIQGPKSKDVVPGVTTSRGSPASASLAFSTAGSAAIRSAGRRCCRRTR